MASSKLSESSRTRRALNTCDSSMVLLPRAQATRAAHKPPSSPQLSPREQGVALTRLSKQLRLSLRLVDRVHRNMTYAACFVAHDAVVWLTNRFDLARPAAVECGEQLRCAGLIQAALPALRDRPFAADMAFFQFLDVPAPPDPLVEPDVTAARVELGGLRLRAVPDCVLRTGIDLLSLRYNEVRTLPPTCVVWAKSLTVLDLGHNAIAVLPSAIGDLRLLRRLRVDGNVLRELPAALGQCTQLRTLSASDNLLLERVPPELAQLKALEVLQINDTRVTVLPAAWKALHGVLTELAVDAEFMRFPPADICVRSDTPALLKYLARHEDEQPPLPEIDDTVVDSLADAEANATAAAAASSAAAAAASAPPSPAAPATPAPTPLTPAPSTPAPPAPPIPPPLSDVVPPEMPAPLNDAPFPERDAMLAKSQRNSGTRARVMTLGTSQMRPTGPAPDPSTPQPWTELTDEEDAASIALFQWATNPRSTERVFHSGMKKFERGKLAPLARSAPVPVEEESAPVEPAARNKKFRDLFTSGPRTPQQQQQQQQQQPQVTAGQREMLLDGEQLAGANAPDHYEAVLLAESIDSAWMAAFDASSLSSSASSAAAARGNSTREAALQVDVEGDGDHIVRLTAPLTRYRTATAPFVSPLVTSLAPMPVWVREARVAQPCDSFDLLLTRPVAPSAAERLIQHGTVFAARSMSTYAWDRASGVRLGDPICDHFAARIAPGRQIYAVADGCGWGQPSARAAQAASRTFVNYIHSRRRNIVDLKSASLEVLLAMAEANANVKRSTTGERIGTTTLVGGVMVKLEFPVVVNAVGRLQQKKQQMRTRSMEMDSSGAPHGGVPHGVNSNSSGHITVDAAAAAATSNQCAYAFVLATVGDVKVFHYQAATQTCCDVSRHVVIDHNKFKSEDPGGRLGAQIDGDADLRNLAVLIVPCAAGDAFAMLSDGVHDNLDPEKLGVLPPPDMGGQQWGALPIEVVDFVKRRFQRHFLEGVLRVASGLPRSAARDAHHGSSSPHDFLSRSPRAAVDFIATRIGGHRAMSQSAHSLSRDPSPVRDAHAEDDAAVDGGGGDKLRRSGYRKARKSSTAARPESDSRENLLAPPTPQPINAAAATEELIAFSRYVTKTSRKFMWNNPRLQLPNDFTSVPGKQDHGTCLICVVGDNGLPSV